MNCYRCDKDMARDDGFDLRAVKVEIKVELTKSKKDNKQTIDFNNSQLGKYSDGKGGCNIGLCYECYIDDLLSKK